MIWQDLESGYFYSFKLNENCKIYEPKGVDRFVQGPQLLVNCGGTIVSGPCGQFTSVKPLSGLDQLIELNGFGYWPFKLKLSENWTLEDYVELEKLDNRDMIITHGTDNISFFAPWIDILAKIKNFKAVIIISQRSFDRPTSPFTLLFRAAKKMLKRLKKGDVVVLTQKEDKVLIHNPYEIKKFHTTHKEGFYSKNSSTFKITRAIFKKPFKLKTPLPPSIEVETPFSKPNSKILLTRGVGNAKNYMDYNVTIVNKGPMNSSLYGGLKSTHSYHTRNLDYSWESLYVLMTFTDLC